ncbi:MAG: hypothetical protein WCT02_02345 [Candidatus Paceibacterota bacterium]
MNQIESINTVVVIVYIVALFFAIFVGYLNLKARQEEHEEKEK